LQRNNNTIIFAVMATDTTGTYQQAKHILSNAVLKDDIIINITSNDVKIFRKHLSELIKRQQSGKRFTSRLLNNNQLKIIRIE